MEIVIPAVALRFWLGDIHIPVCDLALLVHLQVFGIMLTSVFQNLALCLSLDRRAHESENHSGNRA